MGQDPHMYGQQMDEERQQRNKKVGHMKLFTDLGQVGLKPIVRVWICDKLVVNRQARTHNLDNRQQGQDPDMVAEGLKTPYIRCSPPVRPITGDGGGIT